MMIFTISRIHSDDAGTFGVLHDDSGVPFALTAELPWHDNKKNISCIPSGFYHAKRVDSPKFGGTFMLLDVPNRSYILFHKGNIPTDDSKGCVIIGEQFEKLNGQQAVISSSKGFKEFMGKISGTNKIGVEIINHWRF